VVSIRNEEMRGTAPDHLCRLPQILTTPQQTFTCFVFLDLVSAVQNRGLGCELFQNKMLVVTVSVSALVQLALVYVPFMQAIFQTDALPPRDLSVILGFAGVSMALHEGRRTFERRLNARESFASVTEEMA